MKFKYEDRQVVKLEKLARELHIPMLQTSWRFEVIKDGKIIKSHKQRSRSWVRNAYNILLSQFAGINLDSGTGNFGAGYLSLKNYSGTTYDGAAAYAMLNGVSAEGGSSGYRGSAASTAWGIIVGTSDSVESFESTALAALIAEGTGAGAMNYILGEVPTHSYDGPSKTWTVVHARYINNNSPGAITVNEVGMVDYDPVNANFRWLVVRDVLGTPVVVPAGGQLKVSFTFTLVFPG